MPALEIDGVQLAYEERGSGPPVLLVHGTGGAVWDPLPELLATAGYRAIYYNRRGFGASMCPPIKSACVGIRTCDKVTVVGRSLR